MLKNNYLAHLHNGSVVCNVFAIAIKKNVCNKVKATYKMSIAA
jgi:hypothetical protein